MGTGVVSLISFVLLTPGRLTAGQAATESVQVPVAKITGFSGSLQPGMRVDALFFAAEADRPLLLALRNVELTAGTQNRATLRLTAEQARAIEDMEPAEVEILVVKMPEGARKPPLAHTVAPPRHGRRHGSGAASYAERAAPGADAAERKWYQLSSSSKPWFRGWRALIWPGLAYLCLELWRVPRRRLMHARPKKDDSPPWTKAL